MRASENPTVNNIASTAALEPGSFYFIPGGEEHISRCSVNSATDCLTFFWQATRFDFAPTSKQKCELHTMQLDENS
jgi:hypothetical protein